LYSTSRHTPHVRFSFCAVVEEKVGVAGADDVGVGLSERGASSELVKCFHRGPSSPPSSNPATTRSSMMSGEYNIW
jgi:hypothetical protein